MTLPTFKDCQTKDDLKKTAIEWIKHLECQAGVDTSDLNLFDFDNQLDDFQNDDGNYSEVIEWIKWFFNVRHNG